MAAELGVAAASLQIIELFGKSAIRSAQLYKRLRNAPTEISQNVQSLEDFRNLCASYKHALSENPTVIDPATPDANHIKTLLERADTELQALDSILSALSSQPTDGRLQSLSKAAKTVHKDRTINTRLANLNNLRDKINSFLEICLLCHRWYITKNIYMSGQCMRLTYNVGLIETLKSLNFEQNSLSSEEISKE